MKKYLFKAMCLIGIVSLFTACQRETVVDPGAEESLVQDAAQRLTTEFAQFHTLHYDHDALYARLKDLGQGAAADIVLPSTDAARPWVLHLRRNGVVEDDFRGMTFDGKQSTPTAPLGIRTFEGTLDGGGLVALTISPTMISGTFEEDGTLWNIDPIQKFGDPRRGLAIAYREQDIRDRATDHGCTIAELPASEARAPMDKSGFVDPQFLMANCWQVEVFVHGDFRYLQQVGGNVNTGLFLMVAAINNSSSRFTAINIRLFVPTGSAVQNTTQDNLSFDANTLLNEVRNVDNWFFPNARKDLTLFFTGRNMNGGTAGIAWVATMCANPSYAYGVAETINGFYNTRIQTHEIGHIIGAGHDGGCPGGLMYPYYNSGCASEYPSTNSYNAINWHFWFNHGCINMAPGC